jgi:uncharacterized protein
VIEVPTTSGLARVTFAPLRTSARAELFLGHGAGGSIDAPDLEALAQALPQLGVRVARVEQPYRVQGKRLETNTTKLDAAFKDAVSRTREVSVPLFIGGRSAGARVAARTSKELGALGVLALAFPLMPVQRRRSITAGRSRAPELLGVSCSMLVIQGTRDAFGGPVELDALSLPPHIHVIPIEGGDHSLLPRSSQARQSAEQTMTEAVAAFVNQILAQRLRRKGRGG